MCTIGYFGHVALPIVLDEQVNLLGKTLLLNKYTNLAIGRIKSNSDIKFDNFVSINEWINSEPVESSSTYVLYVVIIKYRTGTNTGILRAYVDTVPVQ